MSAVEKELWLQGGAGVNRMVSIPLGHLHPLSSCGGGSPPGCSALLCCSVPAYTKPFLREDGGLECCYDYGPGGIPIHP